VAGVSSSSVAVIIGGVATDSVVMGIVIDAGVLAGTCYDAGVVSKQCLEASGQLVIDVGTARADKLFGLVGGAGSLVYGYFTQGGTFVDLSGPGQRLCAQPGGHRCSQLLARRFFKMQQAAGTYSDLVLLCSRAL